MVWRLHLEVFALSEASLNLSLASCMETLAISTPLFAEVKALPEVLSYTIAGKLLDTYPGYQGYHLNFLYMIAMGVIGLIVAIIWTKKYGKKKADATEA